MLVEFNHFEHFLHFDMGCSNHKCLDWKENAITWERRYVEFIADISNDKQIHDKPGHNICKEK